MKGLAIYIYIKCVCVCMCVFSCLWVFFFFFPGLHLRRMEVPRLGVEWKLQLLAYTRATATADRSHIYNYAVALGNASLTHWVRPGIELASSWMLVGFVTG